jgi:hypothetical protein
MSWSKLWREDALRLRSGPAVLESDANNDESQKVNRYSRESGNLGAPALEQLPWTPAFAGATITDSDGGFHFEPGS